MTQDTLELEFVDDPIEALAEDQADIPNDLDPALELQHANLENAYEYRYEWLKKEGAIEAEPSDDIS